MVKGRRGYHMLRKRRESSRFIVFGSNSVQRSAAIGMFGFFLACEWRTKRPMLGSSDAKAGGGYRSVSDQHWIRIFLLWVVLFL